MTGSLTADWLHNSGTWVFSRSPVEHAVNDTCRYYDRVRRSGIRRALKQWVEGGAFAALMLSVKDGEVDDIEERFIESFRSEGDFHDVDPDRSRTQSVLDRFIGHLRGRLLEAGNLGLLYERIETTENRLRSGQESLARGQDQLSRLANEGLAKHDATQEVLAEVLEVVSENDASPPTSADLDSIEQRFKTASLHLLAWPRSIEGAHIERPELDTLLKRVAIKPHSVTLVEGLPGTGKSALLSGLANQLHDGKSMTVVALKADALPLSLDAADGIVQDVPGGTVAAVKALAARRPVVVVLDQLDALSDVSDMRPGRLNAVLDLIGRLREATGVHVVASIRPFEREADTRLQGALREVVTLEKFSWPEAAGILGEAGHDPARMGNVLREILRVPAYLKVFVNVAEPGATYESWHRLYEELWRKHILGGPDGATSLVQELIGWMSEEEALWAPSALVDAHSNALAGLQRNDVLISDPETRRIGFRHQTLFEFARSRSFVRGDESLVEHVRERQDGVFVRPVLVAGLTALRESSLRRYHEAARTFLSEEFRDHIRTLVSGYVARQPDPTEPEVQMLLPLLEDQKAGGRLLPFVRQSPGWFAILHERGTIQSWMSEPPNVATPVLTVLVAASRRGEGNIVFRLVQEYWFDDPAYHSMTLSALDEIPVWPAEVSEAMTSLLPNLRRTFRYHVVECALRGDTEAAFSVLRRTLDLEEADARSSLDTRGQGFEANGDTTALAAALNRGRARSTVVREWHQWTKVASCIADAPQAFAESVWPWFETALLDEPVLQEHDFAYSDPPVSSGLDEDDRNRTPAGAASLFLSALAEANADVFEEIAERLATDARQRTQRVLMEAYVATVEEQPKRALEHLLADPRRMLVRTFGSQVGTTVKLIEAVSPHLSEPDRHQLEEAIESFAPARPKDENAERWEDITERTRIRLMRSVKTASEDFEEAREEAEAARPNVPDEEQRWPGFSAVAPPVPASRLADLNLHEWTDIIDRTLDGEGKMLAERYHDEPPEWPYTGNEEQQSRAFGELAEQEPLHARELLDQLNDHQYEPFVTAIIGGIGEAEGENADAAREDLPKIIMSFAEQGFDSPGFRYRASAALAALESGLSKDTLDLLERWFWEAPSGEVEVTNDPNADRVRSLLFGHRTWVSGGGQSHVLRALAARCFYQQPPGFERWLGLIERIADEAEPYPKTVAAAIRHSQILFSSANPDHDRAADAIRALAHAAPAYASRTEGLVGLSLVLRHLASYDEAARELIDLVQTLNWDDADQACGELMWMLYVGTNEIRTEEWIRDAMEESDDLLRGLSYGAAATWGKAPSAQPLALGVLRLAAQSGDTDTAAVPSRALSAFRRNSKSRSWLEEDEPLIEALLEHEAALKASAEELLAACSSNARRLPELSVRVGEAVVELFESGSIQSHGRLRWALVEPLTQLALTLHRFDDEFCRNAGLELFESVHRLGFNRTRKTLRLLDRSPLQ